jgi:multiple sugar transport system ATP-binding protein
MATVTLSNIRKNFGDLEIIKGVNLDIDDREFCVFVGPSGCGKSTLLRLVAGLEEITSGDLLIDGEKVNDVPPAKRGLAMVFQSYALYPHMSVAGNMGFSLRLAGVPKAERDAKVREVARVLQLEPLLKRKPKELSGGQRQRVAIGRAIVRNPRVFLFDEPLSNLDAALRVQMRIEISRLHEQLNVTMIYVTHDQIEAMTMADKIVVLQAGVIEQVGSPLELYHHPRNQFVAGFIGSPKMNFLPATVAKVGPDGVTVNLPSGTALEADVKPDGLLPGEKVTLGVRPEHLALADDGQIRGEVLVAERLGGETFVYVQVERGDLLTIQADGNNPARVHDRVGIKVNSDSCYLFNEASDAFPRARRNPLADMRHPTLARPAV